MRDNTVYWGWRPLVFYVFISVLVASCSDNYSAPTVAPTSLPPLTLTLRIYASPPPTSTPIVPQVATLRPQFTTLRFTPPTCSETITEGLVCFGYLHNTSPHPLTHSAVLIELYRADGSVFASKIANIEQMVIPAGESAPYRALFLPPLHGQYTRIVASLQRADVFEGTAPPLIVEDPHGMMVRGRYRVEARLHNPGMERLENIRVVVTVYNMPTSEWREVVGYRVITVERLDAGESMPVAVEIMPQVMTSTLTHSVYAEVWGAR